jgi:predicted acylesterase/phospholipase RssA
MTSLEGVLSASNAEPAGHPAVAGQVVLVMQGGGAQAAYQGGVYQALHEANLEPDWVIGTSIGAINGSIIAGNKVASRLERLRRVLVTDRKPANLAIGADVWKWGEPAHDPADRRARLLFTQRGVLVGS